MGLLDGVLGSVVNAALGGARGGAANPLGDLLANLSGGGAQGSANMLTAVLGMVQKSGGLDGLLGELRRAGLGGEVDSWIGTGANRAVGAEQLVRALGGGNIAQLAASLGMQPDQAGSALAKLLPELVDRFTPDGKMPADPAALLRQAMEALGKR